MHIRGEATVVEIEAKEVNEDMGGGRTERLLSLEETQAVFYFSPCMCCPDRVPRPYCFTVCRLVCPLQPFPLQLVLGLQQF